MSRTSFAARLASTTRVIRSGRRGLVAAPPAVLLALVLAACATGDPQTTLDPKGPFAAEIYKLFVPVMAAALFVFVVVEALIIVAVIRFRGREGDPLPPQIHGNTRLEILWTIIPALILIVILLFTFRTQAILASPPESPNAITVRVVGHQWWWEFDYPDLGVVTASELHIPVGETVKVELESVDVIHSFWVPHLAGKTDVIPGRVNRMWLRADEPGTYSGQCAEFCGLEHALMRFVVIAEPASTFNAWVQQQRGIPPQPGFGPTPTPPATTQPGQPNQAALIAQGYQLFSNGACITCHTLRGTPAQAKVGPDLTHFGSRKSIAGNTLPNTPENLKRWLRNPQEVKPGNDMPNLNLSDSDVEALAAYLESLK